MSSGSVAVVSVCVLSHLSQFILWRSATHAVFALPQLRQKHVLLPAERPRERQIHIQKLQIHSLRQTMSASTAKVSRKELNSNHDGADETSGKEWRPSQHRHFHLFISFLFFMPLALIVGLVG